MFKESFHNGVLPSSLRGALITLLPKVGKPNNKCENLMPTSLLKTDLKVLRNCDCDFSKTRRNNSKIMLKGF